MLSGAVFLAYLPLGESQFINYDDGYVYENPHVNSGLTKSNVLWAFGSIQTGNWHPATWLSHQIDCAWYGRNAGGHHLTNLLLHIANSVLLFLLLKSLTGAFWRSAAVAALFALHPLHVETVAWISERKDVLSTFFLLLTIWAYARYAGSPRPRTYGIAVICFILGILSKPMVVTLPLLLLALDFWPLRRWRESGRPSDAKAVQTIPGPTFRTGGLLMEKVPFFILSAVCAMVAFLAQNAQGAVGTHYPVDLRLSNAMLSYVKYMIKMLWPEHLGLFYPYPGSLTIAQRIIPPLLLAAISVIALLTRKKMPWVLSGWLWYGVSLVPVIGIVQVGMQSMADRYTYLPLVGLFVAAVWTAAEAAKKLPQARPYVSAAFLICIASLAVCTRKQVGYWHDNFSLFRHSIAISPMNFIAHNNLGLAFESKGAQDSALYHYTASAAILPTAVNLSNIGFILQRKDMPEKAMREFHDALALDSGYAMAHVGIGTLLETGGNDSAAKAHFRRALRDDPQCCEAWAAIGRALCRFNHLDSAIVYLRTALSIKPDCSDANYRLGLAMERKKDFSHAVFYFSRAVDLAPNSSEQYNHLGYALLMSGDPRSSVRALSRAISIAPDSSQPYLYRGRAYERQGLLDSAIADYRTFALRDSHSVASRVLIEKILEKKGLQDSARDSCISERDRQE